MAASVQDKTDLEVKSHDEDENVLDEMTDERYK
jgi:hypothetical protein